MSAPTAEEIRAHADKTFTEFKAAANSEKGLSLGSVALQQTMASYEIAAQLAELNAFLRAPGEWAIVPPNLPRSKKP